MNEQLHAGATALVGPMTMPLGAFETGARVFKFDPQPHRLDRAYMRIGRVIRETFDDMEGVNHRVREHLGVLYDGTSSVMEYSEDTHFRYAAYE